MWLLSVGASYTFIFYKDQRMKSFCLLYSTHLLETARRGRLSSGRIFIHPSVARSSGATLSPGAETMPCTTPSLPQSCGSNLGRKAGIYWSPESARGRHSCLGSSWCAGCLASSSHITGAALEPGSLAGTLTSGKLLTLESH